MQRHRHAGRSDRRGTPDTPIGWRGLAGSSAPARAPWCQDHHRRVRHGRQNSIEDLVAGNYLLTVYPATGQTYSVALPVPG